MITPKMHTVTNLVDGAAAGGYDLPEAVTEATAAYRAASALQPPTFAPYDTGDAADALLSGLAAQSAPDVLELARRVTATETEARLVGEAGQIMVAAAERAAWNAVAITADLAEQIITAHLAPALELLYTEARKVADDLGPYGTNPAQLITAPAKARNAYGSLSTLVARRDVIFRARSWVNSLAGHTPQHDERGLFVEFRNVMALLPELQPTQRVPDLPAPTDPAERLLWVVGEGAAGEPWLPTVAQMDARWWDHFGEAVKTITRNRDLTNLTFAR